MSGQHTPGPWGDGIHHRTRSGGREVAHVHARGRTPPDIVPIAAVPLGVEGYGFEEGCANARLIAASPEMLPALKLAIPLLERERQSLVECCSLLESDGEGGFRPVDGTLSEDAAPDVAALDEAISAARAAIAKAEG